MPGFRILARTLKRDVMTLWFAMKHPDTPWYARALAALVTTYAASPVDLIPDFIPVLGLLDDLIIIPAGVWLLLKIVPDHVLAESRAQAERWFEAHRRRRRSLAGLAIVLALWALAAWAIYAAFGR
jgi:uncharacterized membrane protein YkvA (DUF1232 family)